MAVTGLCACRPQPFSDGSKRSTTPSGSWVFRKPSYERSIVIMPIVSTASACLPDRQHMSTFADRFAGRAAVITGGASGLGLEVAQRIMAEGGRVSLWDWN